MKNKKGFTLIELLAVIVILAIIAIIAVPIILNVIEKSKESSAVDSAYGYIHAIENGIVEKEVNDKVIVENREYEDLRSFERDHNINVKGNKPVKGLFRLEKRQVVYAEFMIDGYSVICEKRKCKSEGKGKIIEITYNASGGVVEKESDKIIEGTSLELLPQPTREHYGFDGWYTEENGGGEKVYNTTVFNEDIILYANWIKDRYTISFDGNGGTPTENSISVEHEGTIEEFPRAEKEGYTFNGWYLEDNTKVTNETVFTEAKTLYAHYTKNTYTVNFNGNGGTSSIASTSVEHGNTITLPNSTKEGYTFNGWYTEATGGSEVTNSTPIKGDMTLYAHYTINTYTVTYNADGGSVNPTSAQVTHGSTLNLPTPTKSGYTFIGWFTASSGGSAVTNSTPITGSKTIYARYFGTVTNFAYTGSVQTFTTPIAGKYKLEVWGAQGIYSTASYSNSHPSGNGAYVKGTLNATANQTLYVYVGGRPYYGAVNGSSSNINGGYNGGGASYSGSSYNDNGPGGGATDISLVGGECSLDSYKRYVRTPASYLSRIIVAGGGGGGRSSSEYANGGYAPSATTSSVNYAAGMTSTGNNSGTCAAGGFGYGASGTATGDDTAGGGGGWYGGGCGGDSYGGGGSSFAWSNEYASYVPANYSPTANFKLTDVQFIRANASMPAPSGGNETGHSGNGYARITYIGG